MIIRIALLVGAALALSGCDQRQVNIYLAAFTPYLGAMNAAAPAPQPVPPPPPPVTMAPSTGI